jgi:hypothetical protein
MLVGEGGQDRNAPKFAGSSRGRTHEAAGPGTLSARIQKDRTERIVNR